MTSGPSRPQEPDRLAEIAHHLQADDPGFAAGLATLRPCEPREYRSRKRRRTAARALAATIVCGIAAMTWLWLDWFVTALFMLESATMAVLMSRDDAADPDPSAI
jgi:hypothetical protein